VSVADLVAEGRAAAEALMVDECEIVRVTGTTTDLETGLVTETTEPVYVGKCRVQQASATAREESPGEAQMLLVARVLQLPVVASAGVRADDQAAITACALDPGLVGRTFVVRAEFAKTYATSRRLGIEEVTS